MSAFKVSVTFSRVTPESAEHGDFSETGFESENVPMTLREVLGAIEREGFVNPSCWPCNVDNFSRGRVWLSTEYATVDYRTGESEERSLHIDAAPRNLRRLWRFLNQRDPRTFR
jgi:hypothetical protein